MTPVTAGMSMRRYQWDMDRSFFRSMLADWKRWSRAERLAAILLLAEIILLQVPLVL